jgi:hypothetical protein
MDEKVQILLNSDKNVNSVNVDTFTRFELNNKVEKILEYDLENALSASDIFDAEREAFDVYRIYGRMEYLSLLNGLKLNYKILGDFFLQQTTNSKNVFNSFKFYLVRPASTGYTQLSGGPSTILYSRKFEVIATPDNFQIYNAGYTNNVYGDQIYTFNFNEDFDVTPYADQFNFPPTELFLYAQYIPTKNGFNEPETMSGTTWNLSGNSSKISITPTPLVVGNLVYGDLIEYSKLDFLQLQLSPQTYYISTPYHDSANTENFLQWKYNPFISFQLRYFYDNLNNVNTGSTSYAQQSTIPYYATPIGAGNFVWRDIVPQGFVDPTTNLGVDYPFVNRKRYLFSPVILDISPNLFDAHTFQVFTEIKYGPPSILNRRPISNINNIGKPCQ